MPPPFAPPTADARRILLIRPSALGDVARTVPCLVSLRRAYPLAVIDWLVDRRFADAVREHPALDRVVPFDRDRFSAAWPLLRQLRKNRYDMVFDLQGLARSGLFAGATGAAVRVGYANAREWGWLGVNRRHRVPRSEHAMPRMLKLLTAEGIAPIHDAQLHVPESDRGWAKRQCAAVDPTFGRYACVAPTARWGCKCWPAERFAALTRRLLSQPDLDAVFVLTTDAERPDIAETFQAALPADLRRRVLFVSTTVGQMMDAIDHAALLVGNDSAPLHLAVGLGTPSVSLFGPTDPAVVGPPPAELIVSPAAAHAVVRTPSSAERTHRYRWHRDDNTLMKEIGLDTVWDRVEAVMGSNP